MTTTQNGSAAKKIKLGPSEPPTDSFISSYTDLASAKSGGKILFATDDGFAVAENLLKDSAPEWKEGVYTEYGKWMDGWETRRKRVAGHDWCIIKLGLPGTIVGFDVDTRYFTGNYPPKISIQAGSLTREQEAKLPPRRAFIGNEAYYDQVIMAKSLSTQKWTELVPMSELRAGTEETHHNYFRLPESTESYTHIRLNLFPDGGVARLRVFGVPKVDWSGIPASERIDLVALANGGQCVAFSNSLYGNPSNLIAPGRAATMDDGWETARRKDRPAILEEDSAGNLNFSGSEWAIFRLGHAGVINAVEVDTHHYKLNYPDSCTLEGCYVSPANEAAVMDGNHSGLNWIPILTKQHMLPNKPHYFSGSPLISPHSPVNYVRLTITPDGGISRFRLWGHIRKVD